MGEHAWLLGKLVEGPAPRDRRPQRPQPASGGVDPAELFVLARAAGPLSMFAAPTIVKRLASHLDHASIRTLTLGNVR